MNIKVNNERRLERTLEKEGSRDKERKQEIGGTELRLKQDVRIIMAEGSNP
jgi:hypothetical protein